MHRVRFIFLACFLSFSYSEIPDGRIMGGQVVDIRTVPYQLAIVYDDPDKYGCGAVIIGRRSALTAAHCVDGRTPRQIQLRAGSSYHASGGSLHDVKKIIIHKNYQFDMSNDLAFLTVKKRFDFGDLVKKIPIAENEPNVGQLALASGWGLTSINGPKPERLRSARFPILRLTDCRADGIPVKCNMICAGDKKSGRTHCAGDDGGPLAVDKKLVGIVSWAGCDVKKPGVFVKLAFYEDWISKLLEEEDEYVDK